VKRDKLDKEMSLLTVLISVYFQEYERYIALVAEVSGKLGGSEDVKKR